MGFLLRWFRSWKPQNMREFWPRMMTGLGPCRGYSGDLGLIRFDLLVGRIVRVTAGVEAIEGAPVIAIERQAELDALRQVRGGAEWAAERDEAGDAVGDGGLRRVGLEAAGRNDRTLEDLAQLLRGHGLRAFGDQVPTLDPGLDDMEIGELEVVEPLRNIAEEGPRIAVRHPVEGAAGRKADTHPIGAPDEDQRLRGFEKQPRPVLDGAAVAVGPLVAVVLQELVDQVAIGGHELDTVET